MTPRASGVYGDDTHVGVGAGPEDASAKLFVPGAAAETSSSAPGRWYKMATPNRNRTHHHSAVLLPDGRVLLGGHSPDGHGVSAVTGDRPDASFEIFTPHYLFRSRTRPTIRAAPEAVAWGEQFDVGTAQASTINSVVLMRLASPQHGTDSDVRTLWLQPGQRPAGGHGTPRRVRGATRLLLPLHQQGDAEGHRALGGPHHPVGPPDGLSFMSPGESFETARGR